MQIYTGTKVKVVSNGDALGTSTVTTDGLSRDQAGDNMFVIPITDITSGCTVEATLQWVDPDGSSNPVSSTTAKVSATSATDDDLNQQALVLSAYRPLGRPDIRLSITRAGGTGAALGSVIALQNEARSEPVADDASIAASAHFAHEDEADGS